MLDKKTLADLKEKHGRIAHLDTEDGRTVVVKKPGGAQYRAFTAKLLKDNSRREEAILDLVRECIVYPVDGAGNIDEVAVNSIFDEWPAFPLTLSGALTDLAGGKAEPRIEKN